MQLQLERRGSLGASGNFGQRQRGAGMRVRDVDSTQTPQSRERTPDNPSEAELGGTQGQSSPQNISRLLSIFQTKANCQVWLINLGEGQGISRSRGPQAPVSQMKR